MCKVTLSYVLTTYNKNSFIKVVLPKLVQNKKKDEEIIIIDGGSSDGTVEYLEDLKNLGHIDYFLSEKDKGEAHGFNKGFLLANGDLIKVITDDDAFNYPTIQECKEFMLLHPEIDVLGGNTGTVSIENKNSLFCAEDFLRDFFSWKEGKLKSFFFNGTCLMIRRSSLAVTGLFNTSGLLTDMEYTLRVTSIANLAWCSGIVSVRILNPQSNNLVFRKRADEESKRLCLYYNYKYPWERKIEEQNKKSVYKKARAFAAKTISELHNRNNGIPSIVESFSSFEEAHNTCLNWMRKHEFNKEIRFISRYE